MFDLLWHSYNYLDPGGGPFLWLGYCHLIYHLKDVKAISLLVVKVRCWKLLNLLANVFPAHCISTNCNPFKNLFRRQTYCQTFSSNSKAKSTIVIYCNMLMLTYHCLYAECD